MAVEALKSSSLTNADATPLVKNNARLAAAAVRGAIGFATADAVASIGSTYRLLRVPSNAVMFLLNLSNDAFTTTGAADIGIYVANGAVVDADFFASAQLLTSANQNLAVLHESAVYGNEDVEKPLWQGPGLSAHPVGGYGIVFALTADQH